MFGRFLSSIFRSAAIAAALLGLVAADASAAPIQLTNATYGYIIKNGFAVIVQQRDFSSPMTGEVTTPLPLTAFATGDATMLSGGYGVFAADNRDNVHATVRVDAPPLHDGGVSFQLFTSSEYQAVVTVKPGHMPPSSITAVPILGSAKGNVSCSNHSAAIADVTVAFLDPLVGPTFAECVDGVVLSPSFDTPETGMFPIGVPALVSKDASGEMHPFAEGGLTGGTDNALFDATVDPTIEIDPSFPFADDFELDFSPGFPGGPSMVSEPGSLALLAVALGVLSVIRGRPRRRSGFIG